MLLFSWEKYEALESLFFYSQSTKVKRPIHFLTNPLLTQHSTVADTTGKILPLFTKFRTKQEVTHQSFLGPQAEDKSRALFLKAVVSHPLKLKQEASKSLPK